jgi:hypothetical protein
MVEPSLKNTDPFVRIYRDHNGQDWRPLLAWKRDRWRMRFFQYGNASCPMTRTAHRT